MPCLGLRVLRHLPARPVRLVSRCVQVLVHELWSGVGRVAVLYGSLQHSRCLVVGIGRVLYVVGVDHRRPQTPAHIGQLRGVDPNEAPSIRVQPTTTSMPGVSGSSRHSADGVPVSSTVISDDRSHSHLLVLTPPSGSLIVACTSMPSRGCLWDRETSPTSSVSTTSMVTSRVDDRLRKLNRSGPRRLSSTSSSLRSRACGPA